MFGKEERELGEWSGGNFYFKQQQKEGENVYIRTAKKKEVINQKKRTQKHSQD